jgi:hypothetical protein
MDLIRRVKTVTNFIRRVTTYKFDKTSEDL